MADEALEFLRWLRKDGPWVLTSIVPDGAIRTRTFKSEHEQGLQNWLTQHDKKNIYFQVNNSGDKMLQKKANKENILLAEFLHVDVDPDTSTAFEESRSLILEKLIEYKTPPSCIIDSGGGYQAFWRLGIASKDLNLVERCNLQLAHDLGGDHCHNIDRIMRLPGTTNWPNKKKIKLGREKRPAELVLINSNEYEIEDFIPAPKVENEPLPILTLEEKIDLNKLNIPQEIRDLIRTGSMAGKTWESRSEAVWYAMCEMVRRNIDPSVILSIMLNEDYAISGHIYDQPNPKGSAIKQIQRAQDYAVDPELMSMNEQFFATFTGGRIRVVREHKDQDLEFMDPGSFEKFFANEQIKVGETKEGAPIYKKKGKWWMEHPQRRSYQRGIIFEPEKDTPDDQYNSWTGFAMRPEEGRLHERYMEHMFENICGGVERYYEYLFSWMARLVQQPATQSETAIVLRSGEGTGKNSFEYGLYNLMPRHFFETPNANHFVGNFNYHLRDKVLVHANEAFYAGDRKHEAALKMLITESEVPMEKKGVDVQRAPNYVHLIISSNNDWVVPAGPDARRFMVLDVGEKQKQNEQYFLQLKKDLQAGGFAHLLYALYFRNLDGFQVRSVPNTEALRGQRIQSMGDVESWWMYCLARGHVTAHNTDWMSDIFVDEAWNDFREEYKNSKIQRKLFTHTMTRLVPKITRERRQIDHQKRYMYILPSLEECRKLFDEVMGGPYDWDAMS